MTVMGGAIGVGNIKPHAEFNILVDPIAADIVFKLGARLSLSMVPLEVTHKVLVTQNVLDQLKERISPQLFSMFQGLLLFFDKTYREVFGFKDGPPLHDPTAVLFALEPQLFEGNLYHVDIGNKWQNHFRSYLCGHL
ncbi:hypothetical protein GEMRC1_002528 [Eukaryota sp. GEM-RC1]